MPDLHVHIVKLAVRIVLRIFLYQERKQVQLEVKGLRSLFFNPDTFLRKMDLDYFKTLTIL